ncbi:SDR family NAD(P)-dependent oxidoreductase [Heyndrickxia oleronia]|uniref:SDR family NAD(P)-dependent oxidoreductase n=1 Tax=Heyndrickxia oleronia TaxID=38875 RepID=A0AAW6T4N6_9BACI|nr:SDR family NAD(P)-dependent oxidoreductase [Heyndrickxia oleronia]MDH5164249.1 SDR family NAD(P)-dependent oxidoreductase [Heyndrickxia oleronia]
MKTLLITGGTSGIGKGLAEYYLTTGNRVIIVSRNKGDLPNAIYLQADLSLASENYRIIEKIQRSYGAIDGLILCAVLQTARKDPLITQEGLEFTFALQYLSRYILSNQLAFYDDSFILNVATPGINGTVNFDDLEHRCKFNSLKANINANRLNDLLGAGFKRKGVRYILYNPMAVRTTGARSVFANPLMRIFLRVVHRLVGHEVNKIVNSIVNVLQESSSQSFSAYKLSKPVDLSMKTFDSRKAKQLEEITKKVLLNV